MPKKSRSANSDYDEIAHLEKESKLFKQIYDSAKKVFDEIDNLSPFFEKTVFETRELKFLKKKSLVLQNELTSIGELGKSQDDLRQRLINFRFNDNSVFEHLAELLEIHKTIPNELFDRLNYKPRKKITESVRLLAIEYAVLFGEILLGWIETQIWIEKSFAQTNNENFSSAPKLTDPSSYRCNLKESGQPGFFDFPLQNFEKKINIGKDFVAEEAKALSVVFEEFKKFRADEKFGKKTATIPKRRVGRPKRTESKPYMSWVGFLLVRHGHQTDRLNQTPVPPTEFEKHGICSKSSASGYFKEKAGSYRNYKRICDNQAELRYFLEKLDGYYNGTLG
jgi:hypothetical protein